MAQSLHAGSIAAETMTASSAMEQPSIGLLPSRLFLHGGTAASCVWKRQGSTRSSYIQRARYGPQAEIIMVSWGSGRLQLLTHSRRYSQAQFAIRLHR